MSIRDSVDPELLREYLRRFPGGEFAIIAKSRVRKFTVTALATPPLDSVATVRKFYDAASRADGASAEPLIVEEK